MTPKRKIRAGRPALALALLLAAALGPRPAAGANTLCVNHGGTGGCFGTIAEALAAAADGDSIRVAGGAPYLEHLQINTSLSLLGDGPAATILDGSASGQVVHIGEGLNVTLADLTVRNGLSGPGGTLQEWGGGIHNDLSNLTLNNVVVSGNHTGANGIQGAWGGGIFSDEGSLTLIDSLVSGNSTGSPPDNSSGQGGHGGHGGGILNQSGTLILQHSTVRANATGQGAYSTGGGGAGGVGGGIASFGGRVVILDSTLADNTTGDGGMAGAGGDGGSGGGLYSAGDSLTIANSTFSGNTTGQGGLFNGRSGNGGGLALVNTGLPIPVSITNTTFSGNATGRRSAGYDSGDGGGLWLTAGYTLTLLNDTLANNDADPGQAGGGLANPAGSLVTLRNTLMVYNLAGNAADTITDCSGSFTSLNYNVITEPNCTVLPGPQSDDQFYVGGAIVNPLADNGGPTQTQALPPGSPAVDTADNAACSPTDQRGFARPVFGGLFLRCDVGAYELYRFGVQLPAILR